MLLVLLFFCLLVNFIFKILSSRNFSFLWYKVILFFNFSHIPLTISVCLASQASFATPIGYECNLMIQGKNNFYILAPGGYKFLDYAILGVPILMIYWVTLSILIPSIFPP
jgi:di/tricarboxylate transporter